MTPVKANVLGWGLLLALGSSPLLAAGSWVAQVPEVRVSLTDRETASAALGSGRADARGHTIHSIVWRYRLPAGSHVNVRLCHPAGCIPLPSTRGTTRELAGMAADVPLEFRFSLAEGQRPVTAQELQVIVNHR